MTATSSARSCCARAAHRSGTACASPRQQRSWPWEREDLDDDPLGPADHTVELDDEAHRAAGVRQDEEARSVGAGRPALAVGPLHGHLSRAPHEERLTREG